MWSAAIFSGSWKGLQKKNALPTFAKYYMLSTYLYLVNSAKMFAKHGWPTETEDTVNQNQTTDYKSPFSGVWPEKRNDTLSKKFLQDIFILEQYVAQKLKKTVVWYSPKITNFPLPRTCCQVYFFLDQTYYFFGKSWGLFMVF